MSGTKRMLHYRVALKQEAVRLVLEEHLTYASVAARLGIRKAERIEVWVRMYRREGELSFHKRYHKTFKYECQLLIPLYDLASTIEINQPYDHSDHFERPNRALICGNRPPHVKFPRVSHSLP